MLTSLIAGVMPDPGEAAAEAGREWGRYITEQPPPYQRLDAGEAVERLTATMEEIGFAPEAVADGTQYRLRLRQCPFREVAENHQDVVCPLHLGLMQGALAQMRAPVTADRLQPFAEPSLCIAYLATRRSQPSAEEEPPEAGQGRRPGMHPEIRVRRIYDDPEPEDGTRVLVDQDLAAGHAQGRRPAGRLGQGRRTVQRTAHVVRPRSGEIR